MTDHLLDIEWTTRGGVQIKVRDMDSKHVVNLAAYLRTHSKAYCEFRWAQAVSAASTLQGDMATYYAEQDCDYLCQLVYGTLEARIDWLEDQPIMRALRLRIQLDSRHNPTGRHLLLIENRLAPAVLQAFIQVGVHHTAAGRMIRILSRRYDTLEDVLDAGDAAASPGIGAVCLDALACIARAHPERPLTFQQV